MVMSESWAFYQQSSTNHLNVQVHIPTFTKFSKSRSLQEVSGNRIKSYDVKIYIDASKMGCGVGSGIFSHNLKISISLRLPDEYCAFSAEIYAIY